MLLSWVIEFAPLPVEVPLHQARALESVFLEEWIGKLDAAYAQELHDSQTKPFTISDLQGRVARQTVFEPEEKPAEPFPAANAPPKTGNKAVQVLAANQPLTWRITTLVPRLSDLVLNKLLPTLPDHVTLNNCGFILPIHNHSLAGIPNHRWAGHIDYQGLLERFLLSGRQPAAHLKMLFASPTSFKRDDRVWLFPTPGNLVDSWLRRWNAFSPIQFPEAETRAYATQALVVNRYRLQTFTVQDEEQQIGFRGNCSLHFLEPDPYWMRVIATLASYAFYCGTGVKTARGMGQTRRVYENV